MTIPLFAAEHIEVTEEDRDCWRTPRTIVDLVGEFFDWQIDLDPCSNRYSLVQARTKWTRADDGLSQDWTQHRTVYCNPPYSDPDPWMLLCSAHPEAYRGGRRGRGEAIACIKVDTSTGWWHRRIWAKSTAICFPSRRVAFDPPPGIKKSSPDFAVAFPYWGHRPNAFETTFGSLGHIEFPRCTPDGRR